MSDRAALLADYADGVLKALQLELAAVPQDKRPRVYYGRGPTGLQTGTAGSINLEMIEVMGATNVAASAGTGGLKRVSLQEIMSWNPDVILAGDRDFAASVKSDPQWASLKAVKDGRVFVVPGLPFGWSDSPPGLNRLIGIPWLGNLLYPESFNADIEVEARRFYRLFYQIELSDEQIKTLMGSAK